MMSSTAPMPLAVALPLDPPATICQKSSCCFSVDPSCLEKPWHRSRPSPRTPLASSAMTTAHNYGFVGYGPQQTLAKIESGSLAEEVEEGQGVAVYVFIPHHVRRAIGSMRMWSQWGRHFPYYVLDEDGGIERKGSFFRGRPRLSRVYDLMKKEQILRYFQVNFPLRLNDDHFALTARILEEAKARFEEQYPGSSFVVLLYPESEESEFKSADFIPWMERAGIAYIDGSQSMELSTPGLRIPHDHHPSGEAHRLMAERLRAYVDAD
jgi:hypothetical protein